MSTDFFGNSSWNDDAALIEAQLAQPQYYSPSNGNARSRMWTAEEDEMLRAGVRHYGPHNWKVIAAEHLHGERTDVQCLHRWQKVLKPGLVKGHWTAEEDQKIIDCMRQGTPYMKAACRRLGAASLWAMREVCAFTKANLC